MPAGRRRLAEVADPRGLDAAGAEARKRAIFAAADAALAASGTVSLELAAAGTPMVIGYRLNALTALIARRLVKLDTVTLVNLVTGTLRGAGTAAGGLHARAIGGRAAPVADRSGRGGRAARRRRAGDGDPRPGRRSARVAGGPLGAGPPAVAPIRGSRLSLKIACAFGWLTPRR